MNLTVEFRQIQCDCGLTFAILEAWAEKLEQNHKSFYCPNCKTGKYWPQYSDVEKLKKRLESLRAQFDKKSGCATLLHHKNEYLKRSRSSLRGHITRLKTRISHENQKPNA